MERIEISGVPGFWVQQEEPSVAALMFRVGRADETLATGGLTHIVEHLALFGVGRVPYSYNGFVDRLRTVFYAGGTQAEVTDFVRLVAQQLGALPLDRLPTELRVLRTEAAADNGDFASRMLNLRYGVKDLGLSHFADLGLRWLAAPNVAEWAAATFTRGNAAFWFASPEPPQFDLDLPAGRRRAAPQPTPIAALELPAYVQQGTGGVGISMTAERTTALTTGMSIALERVHHKLRVEQGLSYSVSGDYEPLSADLAHVSVVADCLDEHVEAVCSNVFATLQELARAGPTTSELSEFAERREAPVDARQLLPSRLDRAAMNELLGADIYSEAKLNEEIQQLSPADVASALGNALGTALVIAPEGTASPDTSLREYRPWNEEIVEGRTYRLAGLRGVRGRANKVIVGDAGVSLVKPDGDVTTVHADDCSALVYENKDKVTLVGGENSTIWIDTSLFRHGDELMLALIDMVPAELTVPPDSAPGDSSAESA